MKAGNIDRRLIDGYLGLLRNLSPNIKLDLISRLTQSIKTDIQPEHRSFSKAFGSWVGKESGKQISEEIRNSRHFNRQIEGL